MTQSRLSPDQLQQYREEGYTVVDEVFEPRKFERLRAGFERRIAALEDGIRPEDMDVPHFTDPELFQWLHDPRALNLVEPILGSDIALFSAHFFCKPAGDGKGVPWHEDAYFWRETIIPSTRAVTLWVAIDPVLEENGCMLVIPGSHRERNRAYEVVDDENYVFDEQIDPAEVDEERAVPVVLAPNQGSLHTATLVHGSAPNHSTMRRCGFTMRYISTTVRFNHEEVGDRHEIYLARGQDRAGNVYGDPDVPSFELMERRGREQNYLGGEQVGGSRPGAG